MRFDKDFIAGLYPLKQIDWQAFPTRAVHGEPLEAAGLSYVGKICTAPICASKRFRDGTICGEWLSAHETSVLERMVAAYPELQFKSIDTLTTGMPSKDNLFAFFDCMIDPENASYLSEDYSFCRRWKAIGGEIWLDLRSRLTHAGVQHFVGDCTLRFASLATPIAISNTDLQVA